MELRGGRGGFEGLGIGFWGGGARMDGGGGGGGLLLRVFRQLGEGCGVGVLAFRSLVV